MSVLRVQFKVAFEQTSKKTLWLWGIALGLLISSSIFALSFASYYKNRFYQGIKIGEVDVGGLTKKEAQQLLLPLQDPPASSTTVVFTVQNQDQSFFSTPMPLQQLLLPIDMKKAVDQLLATSKRGTALSQIKQIIVLLNKEKTYSLQYPVNQELLSETVSKLALEINNDGKPPSAILEYTNDPSSLVITPGENGFVVNLDQSIKQLEDQILIISSSQTNAISQQIELPLSSSTIDHQLSDFQLGNYRNRLLKFVGKELLFTPEIDSVNKESMTLLNNNNKTINDQLLIDLVNPRDGFNHEKITDLVATWAKEIDQEPTDASFSYDPNTLRATNFSPHKSGLKIDQEEVAKKIIESLQIIEDSTESKLDPIQQTIKIIQAEPNITLAQTNDLGINELIGFGESYYRGSIPSRIHNVKTASDYLNMAIVPPNESFSFNQTVGKVDGSTGFKQAYVIRSGSTLLEFGGGVCQVSTTMFRAMLDAGVNITKRLPHSYRVSYYELDNQPGFDATVYSGEVDLRFINDTPGHLLIISEADSTNAYMTVKIYGTNDGRRSEISDYKQWDYTSPPPSQDIHDPSLAPGQRKQVENAIPGIKTSFNWTVTNSGGEVIHQKTFFSHYRAWGAKYLVGI